MGGDYSDKHWVSQLEVSIVHSSLPYIHSPYNDVVRSTITYLVDWSREGGGGNFHLSVKAMVEFGGRYGGLVTCQCSGCERLRKEGKKLPRQDLVRAERMVWEKAVEYAFLLDEKQRNDD